MPRPNQLLVSGRAGGSMAQGLYRLREGWVTEDSVRVRYKEGNELEVPASLYIAHGFQPPLEELPWDHDV